MRKTFLVLVTTCALVLGFATLADAATTKKSFKVSIKSSVGTSQAGRFITISGKVSGPGAGGKKVKVQRQYVGGTWTTVATVITKKSGRYRAVVETPRGGTTSFRATKAKSSARKAGVSATRALPVYQWINLANQGGFVSDEVNQNYDVEIGGVSYPHSYLVTSDGYFTQKLKSLCTALTMRVGYTVPNAQPADTFDLNIGRNQATGPSINLLKTVTSGVPITVTTSLVGTDYINVSLTSITDPGNYTAYLGTPRAYCNASELPSWNNSDI